MTVCKTQQYYCIHSNIAEGVKTREQEEQWGLDRPVERDEGLLHPPKKKGTSKEQGEQLSQWACYCSPNGGDACLLSPPPQLSPPYYI